MRYLLWLLLKLRLYDLLFPTRKRLAEKYLGGCGLEIGALHLPLAVPKHATVRYVDRASVAQLRAHYPELGIFRLTPVDIIDNGETLDTIAPASQDFIIANHFIEHCEDPIKTIKTHLSRLKPGGTLYMAVPDKTKTFDKHRHGTSLDHVLKDFQDGPERSRYEHYQEWARLVEKVPEIRLSSRARELMEKRQSIHYHVWKQPDFLVLLEYVKGTMNIQFSIRDAAASRNEFIVILQKE
jgi:SAM-dependent methyltransferase